MKEEEINIKKTINHWISRLDQDFETMLHLYKSKDYHWSLFIGQLMLKSFDQLKPERYLVKQPSISYRHCCRNNKKWD